MQIVKFDKEREDRIAVERKERFEAQIDRQKGFRWIIEAMHGSNIANLDLMECAKDAITGVLSSLLDIEDKTDKNQASQFSPIWIRSKPTSFEHRICFEAVRVSSLGTTAFSTWSTSTTPSSARYLIP